MTDDMTEVRKALNLAWEDATNALEDATDQEQRDIFAGVANYINDALAVLGQTGDVGLTICKEDVGMIRFALVRHIFHLQNTGEYDKSNRCAEYIKIIDEQIRGA